MKEELRSGLLFGLIGLLAIVSLSAGLYYFADFGSPTETVASEPVPEEVSQSPRQWTAPMQRWLEAGNRLVVDFVHEDGWCAIAIQRPATEEGEEGTIQCIK